LRKRLSNENKDVIYVKTEGKKNGREINLVNSVSPTKALERKT